MSHSPIKLAWDQWEKKSSRREVDVTVLVGPLFITDVTHDTDKCAGQMELAFSLVEKEETETVLLLFLDLEL